MSRQSITDLIAHAKIVTSQELVLADSAKQRTENPRVESSVITPVNTHPEGSDLIGAFLCLTVFVLRGVFLSFLICVDLLMWAWA